VENANTLERLGRQVDNLIGALQQAREENARLRDELAACRTHGAETEARLGALQEQMGYKDMELEDLAVRIEGILGAGDTANPVETPPQEQPQIA
jgi:chromosome segregation ATPase